MYLVWSFCAENLLHSGHEGEPNSMGVPNRTDVKILVDTKWWKPFPGRQETYLNSRKYIKESPIKSMFIHVFLVMVANDGVKLSFSS